MPVDICPNCSQKFTYVEYDSDFEHKCHGSSVFVQEDRVRIDDPNYNTLGYDNKLSGKLVGTIDGPKIGTYTPRGNNDSTHYQRQHYEFIDLGDK